MPRPGGLVELPENTTTVEPGATIGFLSYERSQSERQIRTAEVVKATLTGS